MPKNKTMAQLTRDDRKDIIRAAKSSDRTLSGFVGANRTVVDKTVYYGRSDAMKALKKS